MLKFCIYKGQHMQTNERYLDMAGKSRDVRITEKWWHPSNYEIQNVCVKRKPFAPDGVS
jgi:hypothetical protein